jgi:hypothetical protein
MAMGNAGIGIYSRRRNELSVATGPSTALCWDGNFQQPIVSGYLVMLTAGVFHGRDGRVVGYAHIEAMGVQRKNADVAGAQYWPYPDCTDALFFPR